MIDPTGAVADVASLFHAGVVDYLGKKMKGARLDAKRISRVLSYADGARAQRGGGGGSFPAAAAAAPAEAPGDGWARIVPGKEYPFAILFVEVDGSEELKKRHEPDNLTGAMETFRAFVERIASQHGGRTWMWSQFGGLVLFPLKNGSGSAPVCGLRLLLSRIFYDVEESPLPGHISFHLALSIGDHRVPGPRYRERSSPKASTPSSTWERSSPDRRSFSSPRRPWASSRRSSRPCAFPWAATRAEESSA